MIDNEGPYRQMRSTDEAMTDDLRALAKAATNEDGYRIEYNDLTGDMYATERGSGSEYGATAVIAQHVIRQFGRLWAGATPEAVLALLDELDALRAVRDAAAEWDAIPPNLTISYNPVWIEAGRVLHAAVTADDNAAVPKP